MVWADACSARQSNGGLIAQARKATIDKTRRNGIGALSDPSNQLYRPAASNGPSGRRDQVYCIVLWHIIYHASVMPPSACLRIAKSIVRHSLSLQEQGSTS
ncbi:hypothetical protein [Aureimonas sp. N4]|uniref:hypothetical protein n=1 Tax=Aureimonas sp. N4 TaxID=1638165 RepID=UPI000AA28ADB|nr:hypothetical protein [Aureimonas sp. N4]